MVQSIWNTVLQFLKKFNTLLPYDPAIMFSIYSKELKIYVHKSLHMDIFIATLFIMGKTWKQPRCPLVGEQINCDTSR